MDGLAGSTGVEPKLPPDLIDRDWYRDANIFALERERIFRRAWHFACTVADVEKPGDYFTLTVAEQPIIVIRGRDGVLRAFLNACTHRGLALTEDCVGARGNCGAVLACMYHGWSFDTVGALTAVPYPEAYGPEFDRGKLGLVPVHCDTFGSLVFVALDPLRPTLKEFLGEAAEWMEPAVANIEPIGRVSWIYEGNWKLWHENFRDNYHPEFVHGMVRYLSHDYADGGSNHGLNPGHSLLRWPVKKPDFERFDRSLKKASGITVNSQKAFASSSTINRYSTPPSPWRNIIGLFPNFDYQQQAHFAASLQICNPLSVDRARIDIVYLAPRDDDEGIRQERLKSAARTTGCWGEVSVDDCEAAERATIGLKSTGTRYSNIGRGTTPGLVGETLDEYSLREYYREYRHYLYEADHE